MSVRSASHVPSEHQVTTFDGGLRPSKGVKPVWRQLAQPGVDDYVPNRARQQVAPRRVNYPNFAKDAHGRPFSHVPVVPIDACAAEEEFACAAAGPAWAPTTLMHPTAPYHTGPPHADNVKTLPPPSINIRSATEDETRGVLDANPGRSIVVGETVEVTHPPVPRSHYLRQSPPTAPPPPLGQILDAHGGAHVPHTASHVVHSRHQIHTSSPYVNTRNVEIRGEGAGSRTFATSLGEGVAPSPQSVRRA